MQSVSEPLHIVLSGGGTGGHVYPLLAVAEAADPGTAFQYVGAPGGLEGTIVGKTRLPFATVDAGAVRGRSPLPAGRSLLRMVRGVAQARALLDRFGAGAVLATGGFVSVPIVVAARLNRVPSVVYLPDLRPGWAVKLLARIATAVAVSFDEVVPWLPSPRVVVTGYPVRPDLLRWNRSDARRALGLPEDAAVVLALGGSRGARSINQALAGDLPRLLERAYLVHASGTINFEETRAARDALSEERRERYRLYPYLDAELAPAMNAADVVVVRSGASTLGELPDTGLPGVLIPYPHAGAHQRLNAAFLAERGAAVVLDDAAARAGRLIPTLLQLLDAPERLELMRAKLRALARPNAARRLFELVSDVAMASAGATARR